jgi:hypothetical protein
LGYTSVLVERFENSARVKAWRPVDEFDLATRCTEFSGQLLRPCLFGNLGFSFVSLVAGLGAHLRRRRRVNTSKVLW